MFLFDKRVELEKDEKKLRQASKKSMNDENNANKYITSEIEQ